MSRELGDEGGRGPGPVPGKSGTRTVVGGDQAPFPANWGRGGPLPVWAAGGPGPVSGNFEIGDEDSGPWAGTRPRSRQIGPILNFQSGGPRRAVPPMNLKGSMLSAHSSCARPGCLSWSLPVPNQPSAAFLAAPDVRRSNRSSETDVQVGGRTENRSVEVDTQDPLLHKPGPSASLLPTASGKLGAAPGLCLTLFFSVLYSGIWSRIPFLHFGSESITSTKLPRSWN